MHDASKAVDMIVVMALNPALDVTYELDRLRAGESKTVTVSDVRAGGKGVNVARVLSAMGSECTLVASFGGASGTEFARELSAAHLDSTLIEVDAETRRATTIVSAVTGEATVLREPGGAPTASESALMHSAFERSLADAKVAVLAGSLPPGMAAEPVRALVDTAQARGLPIVVDSSTGSLLTALADAGATVVKANAAEVRDATSSDPISGAFELIDRGARNVIVTLGEEGMLAVSRSHPSQVTRARLAHPVRGNPTGAGDAATAAIARGLAYGAELESTLRTATAWAAAAVSSRFAGDLTGDIEEYCRQVETATEQIS